MTMLFDAGSPVRSVATRVVRPSRHTRRALQLVLDLPRDIPGNATSTPTEPNERNATKPCEGCPKRASCKAPCEELLALLPPEEIRAPNEISSPALMAGRGYSESFMVRHPALMACDDEGPLLWPVIVAEFAPLIRSALEVLTPTQRELMGRVLAGQTRAQAKHLRGVSRQSIHKVWHKALERLREVLGSVPDSEQLLSRLATLETG